MVLSPPAGIVGVVALFSSPISSHLSSSRHNRTKEALTPWHNRHEGFPNVSREIRKILTERASHFNIALDDVSITSLTFGKEFTAAIEAKQGEAKSAQLIGQAIVNNPAFTLRKIEAAREIAHTISNSANKVYLNSDDLFIAT
ncbi:hypothetical protein AHAS_Ahas04G0143400 [Arachis hypogaea]